MRVLEDIKEFKGHGRLLTVQFACWRCGTTATRPLQDCLPTDGPARGLYDLKPPADWKNGGFYYPTFCPDCSEKYDRFMKGQELEG